MFICANCKIEKSDDEFFIKNGRLSHYWCKSCNRENVKERKRKLKLLCVEYKGGTCVDCGGVFHPSVFDFHHLDPTGKDLQIGSLCVTKITELVKLELDKCVLLCSNCHRLRHYTD